MCLLLEKPRQLTSEELYAGERFQSGWWVAKAQFYKLVQESERGYQLAREFLLNLNCMVRVPAPKFEGGAGGQDLAHREVSLPQAGRKRAC